MTIDLTDGTGIRDVHDPITRTGQDILYVCVSDKSADLLGATSVIAAPERANRRPMLSKTVSYVGPCVQTMYAS
jgi:hypothetical protein